jgi:hypothetical protein
VPKTLSLGLIVVIFVIAFLYARRHEQKHAAAGTGEAAQALLTDEPPR